MDIVTLSNKILEKVIGGKSSFSLAVHNATNDKKIAKTDRVAAAALSGCALRHYYLFERIVNDNFPETTDSQKYFLFTFLSNNIFVHKINDEEMTKKLLNYLKNTDYKVNKNDFQTFLESIKDKNNLIPSSVVTNSPEYLSLRFNVQPWLIKMWKKHFGERVTYSILKANTRSAPFYCRLNQVSKEDLLKKYKDFEDIENDSYVRYIGKDSLKKHPAYVNFEVYRLGLPYKYIFDKLDLNPFQRLAFYGGTPISSLIVETIAELSKYASAEVILSNSDTYYDTKHLCDKLHLNKFNLYEANSNHLITIISEPVQVFFVSPENSRYELFRIQPEFALRATPDVLDEILIKEEEALCDCSSFVDNGGYLVYVIPTINLKEGHRLVNKFLNEHQEFHLVEEKQFFPFDKFASTLYFAILQKEIEQHD